MFISDKGFKIRKAYFCKEGEGFFNQTLENQPGEMINPEEFCEYALLCSHFRWMGVLF